MSKPIEFDEAKLKAMQYVRDKFSIGSTKGLHVKTCAQYAYEDGYKDAIEFADTQAIEFAKYVKTADWV